MAVSTGSIASYLLMFLLGGLSFPLYSLGIAYTNDWIEPSQILGASAALITVNGIGATTGPLLTSVAMTFIDPRLFFAVLVVAHLAIAVYLSYRIVFREAIAVDDQVDFRPFPARASAGVVNLLARRRVPQVKNQKKSDRAEG